MSFNIFSNPVSSEGKYLNNLTSGITLPAPIGFPPNSLFFNTTTDILYFLDGNIWVPTGGGGGIGS